VGISKAVRNGFRDHDAVAVQVTDQEGFPHGAFPIASGIIAKMRKTRVLAIAGVVLAICSSRALTDEARSTDVTTEHYSLHVENLDAGDVGHMLDDFYRQMTGFCGKAPPAGKLRVEIYSTKERFHAALDADKQPLVDAGGYYSPGTRKAYLWIQPSQYFTRQLILHEATHQFHYLALTRNQGPAAKWYTEGLAEYYGMHNWDGVHLTLCTVPPITLEDYPASAIDHFKNKLHSDLSGMITGQVVAERPESWALIHFLADEYPKQFSQLRVKLDHQMDPAAAWRAAFGQLTPKFVTQFESWMEKHSQPWKIVWVGWQQFGDDLEGKSKSSALAVLKQTPPSLSVAVDPKTATGKAGLIFGFESAENFNVWQLWGANQVRIVRRVKGKWAGTQMFNLAPHDGAAVLSLAIANGAITLGANGVEITHNEAAGQIGLYVQNGSARFRVGK